MLFELVNKNCNVYWVLELDWCIHQFIIDILVLLSANTKLHETQY